MARRRYALERGGPRRLEVRWRWRRRDMEVLLDGARVAGPFDRAAFERGATFMLPDATTLTVRWVKPAWWTFSAGAELRVERQGVPVPRSDGDPHVIGRRAARVVGAFGMLTFLFAVGWRFFAKPGVAQPGALLGVAAEGLLLLFLALLGLFGLRFPILVAAILFGLNALAAVGFGLQEGSVPSPIGLFIQIAVAIFLFRSWRRMKPLPPPVEVARIFE